MCGGGGGGRGCWSLVCEGEGPGAWCVCCGEDWWFVCGEGGGAGTGLGTGLSVWHRLRSVRADKDMCFSWSPPGLKVLGLLADWVSGSQILGSLGVRVSGSQGLRS